MKKICLVVALLLILIIIMQTTPLINVLNKTALGVCVDLSKSGFFSMQIEDDNVVYRCYVTLVNCTGDEKIVRIQAIQLFEFMVGSLNAPFMKVSSEKGQEQIFVLAACEERVFEVEFTVKKGWNAPLKLDRNLPAIVVI